ncbi:MAG: hypothetical protein GY793_10140 [Proteobacteria bacterium]|nr:hypothetical protein [Pseudomonadota bacterium]
MQHGTEIFMNHNINNYTMRKQEKVKLKTDVVITYKENGNIHTCASPYDNAVTNNPLK